MAGAYAHLTVVATLSSPKYLQGLGGLSRKELAPLLQHTKFFELGAVSPDYPYLHVITVGQAESQAWANTMHLKRTGDRVRAGIAIIKKLPEHERSKALAWLLGFISHIITDVVVHPIVERKVGPYLRNKRKHRVCEMNQDMFIYDELGVGYIVGGEFLKTGLATCCDPNDSTQLDPLITRVWGAMLENTDTDQYRLAPPQFRTWHNGFLTLLSKAVPGRPFAWSRHLFSRSGLLYPQTIDYDFITNLTAPNGKPCAYRDVFDKARQHVREYWDLAVRACLTDESVDLYRFRNWSLDTGRDERGKITFWEEA